jgi:protein-S-isoprenylcysteine O-methyltransferase Ste14
MRTNLITLTIFIVALALLSPFLSRIDWTPTRMAGAALAAAALLMLVVARMQLGAAFAVRAQAKTLVTTGIYSRIRNPIYIFGALFLVGLSIMLENWLLLVLVVVLVPLQIVRARKEEAALAEAFGEEYARYKAQTWF